MIPIALRPDAPTGDEFATLLRSSSSYAAGSEGRRRHINASLPRLHRIFRNLVSAVDRLEGPTLDIASGWGVLFPALNARYPECLPYAVAELNVPGTPFPERLTYDGYDIPVLPFQCERDRLEMPDRSAGTVLFCNVLEHLLVDPLWPLLEINRILREGGRLVLSTPNAASTARIIDIFLGRNPAAEAHIKPNAVYQRRNREWTLEELERALQCCGFDAIQYSTNVEMLEDFEHYLLGVAEGGGIRRRPPFDYGPEIVLVAEKVEHRTLDDDLPEQDRWPDWLYSGASVYHRRPRTFPIVLGSDYE